MMADLPMIGQPQDLSILQITFGVIFLLGFFLMKLGAYRNSPWLYVKLMNLSQPYKKTTFPVQSKAK
jgi:NAD(P)H-quinone oxidoreductase subunit 5